MAKPAANKPENLRPKAHATAVHHPVRAAKPRRPAPHPAKRKVPGKPEDKKDE
jgi:hypothetical protein